MCGGEGEGWNEGKDEAVKKSVTYDMDSMLGSERTIYSKRRGREIRVVEQVVVCRSQRLH